MVKIISSVNLIRESWNPIVDFLAKIEEILPRWVNVDIIYPQTVIT